MATRKTAAPEPAPETTAEEVPTPTATDEGGTTWRVTGPTGYTGRATYTVPGVESYTFDVEDGIITTTKERAAWLLRNGGAKPVPQKEA